MDGQPQESGVRSEPARGDPSSRHLLVSLALAGLVVVSLGVGFLGGYLAGGGRLVAPAAQTGGSAAGGAAAHGAMVAGGPHQTGPGGTVTCPFDLPAEHQWILAGMTCVCNEPHCNRTPLLSCHCDNAHSMKALAKQFIAEGMKADQIAAELEKRFGPGVVPTPAANQGARGKQPGS